MTAWTAADVPDQSGRVVVVTGANSGLGFEATRALARAGATVVMACRDTGRGERAAREIRESVPGADLDVRRCDLADLEVVAEFAASVRDAHDEVHVLCNNAGVMAVPRSETADGFETQFGVNHLGHFALTGHLLDRLVTSPGETRIVTHSSGVHERGDIDFEDLHGERSYGKWRAYAQSKLANVLFAYELQRRLDAHGVADTKSLACHPGYANTNLQRRGPEAEGSTLKAYAMRVANALFAQPASHGALPLLYAATAPDVEGGEYYGPDGLFNARGSPERQRSSERSYDADRAERLWAVSEELTGVSFEFESLTAVEA